MSQKSNLSFPSQVIQKTTGGERYRYVLVGEHYIIYKLKQVSNLIWCLISSHCFKMVIGHVENETSKTITSISNMVQQGNVSLELT